MREAYRVVATRFADAAFTGEGARLVGGRWNSQGQAAVYLSSHLSLAILELLVHLEGPLPLGAFSWFRVLLPKKDVELPELSLPEGWRSARSVLATRAIGDAWLKSGKHAALELPSVIVPHERNLLLQPARAKLCIEGPFPLDLDARLGK